MQLPERMPARPLVSEADVRPDQADQGSTVPRIEPAGCCVEICGPLGCTCVAEAPFC
jgi:hypothetical protein